MLTVRLMMKHDLDKCLMIKILFCCHGNVCAIITG